MIEDRYCATRLVRNPETRVYTIAEVMFDLSLGIKLNSWYNNSRTVMTNLGSTILLFCRQKKVAVASVRSMIATDARDILIAH